MLKSVRIRVKFQRNFKNQMNNQQCGLKIWMTQCCKMLNGNLTLYILLYLMLVSLSWLHHKNTHPLILRNIILFSWLRGVLEIMKYDKLCGYCTGTTPQIVSSFDILKYIFRMMSCWNSSHLSMHKAKAVCLTSSVIV